MTGFHNSAAWRSVVRLLILALIIGAAIQSFRYSWPKPRVVTDTKTGFTSYDFAALHSALTAFVADDPEEFRRIVVYGEHPIAGPIGRHLGSYLRSQGDTSINKNSPNPTEGINDRWYHPFILSVLEIKRTNSIGIEGTAYSLLIRSCGPNGRDEQGRGDDIQRSARNIFVPD
jgi:hypothetical protein